MSDRKMSMISRAEHDRIRAWFERMKPRDGKLSRVELRDGGHEVAAALAQACHDAATGV